MTTSRIVILLQVAAVCALPVMAADIDARGAARADCRYDTETSTLVIDGRIDFEVDVGPLSVGGAYRAYDFGEGGYNPRAIDPVYDIKHRYLEGRTGGLFFRGGHYFSTFGRGLALRSFEDIGLEHDTSLDGVVMEYETGSLAFAGLGGRATERVGAQQERDYRIRGARVAARLGQGLSIALSGVSRATERKDAGIALPEELSDFSDHVVAGEAEAWLGALSFTGEYARREGDYYPELKQGNRGGHGLYLSGTAVTSWSTLLAEYKDYETFEHALINPPTCVRDHVWILMNRVTHQVDLGNERGFLVEGTLMPTEAVQITGGASEARRQGGGLAHWEIFGQMDHVTAGWGVSSVAGAWAREYVLGRFTEYMTGVIDLVYEAGPLRQIEVGLEAQRTEEPSGEIFENYLTSLEVYPGPGLTFSVVGETTTQTGLDRDFWVFGDVRTRVSDDIEVSLGGGTERGGKKCSGGICFTEPEFAGVRVRLLTHF